MGNVNLNRQRPVHTSLGRFEGPDLWVKQDISWGSKYTCIQTCDSCLRVALQELILWKGKWLMSTLVSNCFVLQVCWTTYSLQFENRWKIKDKNDNKVPFFKNNRKKDYVRRKPVWPPTERRHMKIMTVWLNTLHDASFCSFPGEHLILDVMMKFCFALQFLRQSTKDFSVPPTYTVGLHRRGNTKKFVYMGELRRILCNFLMWLKSSSSL